MANIQRYNNRYAVGEISSFFDDFFNDWALTSRKMPLTDVEENDKEYIIKAEVPGFDEENINLYVENHVLHITGETKSSDEEKDGKKYLLRERFSESFERTFSLPENTDDENVSAAYEKGVLTVTVPKKAKVEPQRIEVKFSK